MEPLDMQAWVAVRRIGEAANRTGSNDPAEIVAYMKGLDFQIGAYRGESLTIRNWDLQVQPGIFLDDGRNVVPISPQPGFLHQITDLDTLGFDRPETKCKFRLPPCRRRESRSAIPDDAPSASAAAPTGRPARSFRSSPTAAVLGADHGRRSARRSTSRLPSAAPVGMQYGEVYSALQTHVVDGQENPLSQITAGKFYEVQKYVSMTNYVWDGYWICCNDAAWKRLPPDLQQIVEKNLNESGLKERVDVAQLNVSTADELKAKGMIFNDTTPDSFRAQLRSVGFYAQWRTKIGDAGWSC